MNRSRGGMAAISALSAGIGAAVVIPAGLGEAGWVPIAHLALPETPPEAGTAAPAPRGDYGSGSLGSWQQLRKVISSEEQIKRVLADDGIFLFGDSIAVQDGKSLAALLGRSTGDSLAVHNWSGQPTSAAVDALEKWARTYGLPRRILMSVNSNDIFSPHSFAAEVDRVLRIAGPGRTVYWVNSQVARTRQPSAVQLADQRNSAWINLQLADAQQRHPNLRIVRWAEFLAAQPGRLTTYLRDGLHTSVPRGQNARNELIVRAIRES